MNELGQLEAHWREFEKKNIQVMVISVQGPEDSQATQGDFPHLVVVSDPEHKLANAVKVIHPQSAPDRSDTTAPTTILVDGKGIVRWTYRPNWVMERLSPSELLTAIDREMPGE
jgi:peroxiredoxin